MCKLWSSKCIASPNY
uniref:Uncharacterized protein n=1 Tax=Rhizophora mucronata TaxID=61149 RepID=A0A2P2PS91_RHIMU